MISRQVFISGRVQGVWFRESTRRCAESLGLHGYVRNLPDGRVEALFEGEAAAVEEAIEFVRHGPEHARVDAVEAAIPDAENRVEDGAESPQYVGFQIR
jgi:acylphosphatase